MTTTAKVAIIGAGVTGITTAYQLLLKGVDVTVFEANPYPAMETSYANGGQLSASNAEVWNSVPTMLKGVQWMFSSGAPQLPSTDSCSVNLLSVFIQWVTGPLIFHSVCS